MSNRIVWRALRYGFLGATCFVGLVSFSGCAGSNLSPFDRSYVNVTEASYAAADMLLQQSKNVVTPETPLHIGMLTNIKRPSETTAFGQVVASQIGARFVQLGYNVTTSPALNAMAIDNPAAYDPNNSAMGYSSPMSSGSSGAGVKSMITGHYAVARRDILVNLRIIEEGTGRVLAAYDYSMPLNSDIKELINTGEDKGSLFSF